MTIADNKLIAIFMGGKTSEMNNKIVQGYQNIWLPIHGICNWTTVDIGNGKTLQYHKSWDWLIPVIDKITSMDAYIKYKDHSSSQFSDGGIYINTKFIDNTYNDVVDFIKWYNNEN
jgi:hypothetical protein